MKKIIVTESQIKFIIESAINEQEASSTREKKIGYSTIKDAIPLKSYPITTWFKALGIVGDNNGNITKSSPEFEKLVSEMKSKMLNEDGSPDQKSLDNFEKMKSIKPNFYYMVIARYKQMKDSNNRLKDTNIVVDDMISHNEQISYNVNPAPDKPTEEPALDLDTKGKTITSGFFKNNEATLTQQFVDFIKNDVLKTIEEAKNVENSTKMGFVNSLTIETSCSTIPNGVSKETFPGKVPTFKELSDARANAIKNYLIPLLMQSGLYVDERYVTLNSNGLNNDGTSGPVYKKGDNQSDFEKFKYGNINLKFSIKTKSKPTEPPNNEDTQDTDFELKSKEDFSVTFRGKGRPKKTPKKTIPPKITKKNNLTINYKILPCPSANFFEKIKGRLGIR